MPMLKKLTQNMCMCVCLGSPLAGETPKMIKFAFTYINDFIKMKEFEEQQKTLEILPLSPDDGSPVLETDIGNPPPTLTFEVVTFETRMNTI